MVAEGTMSVNGSNSSMKLNVVKSLKAEDILCSKGCRSDECQHPDIHHLALTCLRINGVQ